MLRVLVELIWNQRSIRCVDEVRSFFYSYLLTLAVNNWLESALLHLLHPILKQLGLLHLFQLLLFILNILFIPINEVLVSVFEIYLKKLIILIQIVIQILHVVIEW